MNDKVRKTIIYASVVFVLALVVYALMVSGRELRILQQQLDEKLVQVELSYDVKPDSVHQSTAEVRQLMQVCDTVNAMVAIYREQLDIAAGKCSVPAGIADANAWKQHQLARVACMQKSITVLVNFLSHQGVKQGHDEYKIFNDELRQQARTSLSAKAEASSQAFTSTEYLTPDLTYFDYLLSVSDMIKNRMTTINSAE